MYLLSEWLIRKIDLLQLLNFRFGSGVFFRRVPEVIFLDRFHQESSWCGVEHVIIVGYFQYQPSSSFRCLLSRPPDGAGEWGEDEDFVALEFFDPVFGKLERVDASGGTDDEGLGASEENAETFFLDGRVESADDGAIFGPPGLGEVHGFDDLRTGTGVRAKQGVKRLIEDRAVAVRPKRPAVVFDRLWLAEDHRSLLLFAVPSA